MRSWIAAVMLLGLGCGRIGFGDAGADAASAGPPAMSLELLAGSIGGPGNVDGLAADARFQIPMSVAVDGAGDVFIADSSNQAIRKLGAAGAVTTLARGDSPAGVAVDGAGKVYVADLGDHTVRKITPAGAVTIVAGAAGAPGSADGTGSAARFNSPEAVAVDDAGDLYVADTENQTIRKITAAGVVTTFAGEAGVIGSADGTAATASFHNPTGVAVDGNGNVYVADSANHTVRKITAAGKVTTLAGAAGACGSADGTGAGASFFFPSGVAVDHAGTTVYVADGNNDTIRQVTAAGVVTTVAGAPRVPGCVDGAGAAARFTIPTGVAVDASGNLYVADADNDTVRKIVPDGTVTTVAGHGGGFGSTDGPGAAARFAQPMGVAAGPGGTIVVADRSNDTIRAITPAGVVTTLAGLAGTHSPADGTGAAARFFFPVGVAVDGAGNVYVGDAENETVRKITAAGGVTTIAGTALAVGSADGVGAAARFDRPGGVAVDGAGAVYVADRDNAIIRKITPDGTVTTVAGQPGQPGSADGPASAAQFSGPSGIAIDATGNLYIADQGNFTIRKLSPDGLVTTLAGSAGATGSADGLGAAARFGQPTGVALDDAGNLYVTDAANATIRKLTPDGHVTTIAGVPGAAGILLGASPRFAVPAYLAVVGDDLVVSDFNAILVLRHGVR